MIHAKSIVIEEFRGIRYLSLSFNEKNFAICGPNGTGKSGIVDAIEFALTGNISRLSGKGTGNVSVKEHAPHVDSRNRPDKARVIFIVSVPSIGIDVTIERNVKDSTNPTYTPDTKEVREVMEQIAMHPEFVLSRRELIRYVITSPGDRAKEIQALLRLDEVERIREVLIKVANSKSREILPLQRGKLIANEQLLSTLEITELSTEKLLGAVNVRRTTLSLPPLTSLSSTTSIKDGLAVSQPTVSRKIPKTQAINDIKKFKDTFEKLSSPEMVKKVLELRDQITLLNTDPLVVDGITREHFLRLSLNLIVDESCPLCDKEWRIDELKSKVSQKLSKYDEISKKRKNLEGQLDFLLTTLDQIANTLPVICSYGPQLKSPIDIEPIRSFITRINDQRKQLEAFIPLPLTLEVLKNIATIPVEVSDKIGEIEAGVIAIPDPTDQDSARDYLTISQERLETYRRASLALKKAEEHTEIARKIYEAYTKTSTDVLEGIYTQVENDFGDLYRDINSEDERSFKAQLIPTAGKLGLDVDFYGKGFFPPGAYHSEGHQDSMGICLYLALMKYLSGDLFTFAVMDDVLMSVDSGHRREVCQMIKNHFPDTQFIFTTHDKIWLKHMKVEGLVSGGASVEFRVWDVDNGPTEWDSGYIWEQIRDALKKNDVHHASSLLRTYLEYFSTELCHRLKARVEFRGDARYELENLLPPAISRTKELLKKGIASAKSWRNAKEEIRIVKLEEVFSTISDKTNVERWMINSAIHYNEWENFQANEFKPVVDAFEKLIKFYNCTNADCLSVIYVLPGRGESQELRCDCGVFSINLTSKT